MSYAKHKILFISKISVNDTRGKTYWESSVGIALPNAAAFLVQVHVMEYDEHTHSSFPVPIHLILQIFYSSYGQGLLRDDSSRSNDRLMPLVL